MSEKISDLIVEPTAPDTTALVPENVEGGFVQLMLKKISNNKIYIYIGIVVIILGLVLYYVFIKNKKETTQHKPRDGHGSLNPTGQEYFVLDNNGNPVKVSGNFPVMNQGLDPLPVPTQQPSQREIMMLKQQMHEHQMHEQQMHEQQMHEQQMHEHQNKPKIKLEHPSNEESANDTDTDINMELERVKANENKNIAEHNLTNSELAEINKKLEMLETNN
jgi:hypothetical protein